MYVVGLCIGEASGGVPFVVTEDESVDGISDKKIASFVCFGEVIGFVGVFIVRVGFDFRRCGTKVGGPFVASIFGSGTGGGGIIHLCCSDCGRVGGEICSAHVFVVLFLYEQYQYIVFNSQKYANETKCKNKIQKNFIYFCVQHIIR